MRLRRTDALDGDCVCVPKVRWIAAVPGNKEPTEGREFPMQRGLFLLGSAMATMARELGLRIGPKRTVGEVTEAQNRA